MKLFLVRHLPTSWNLEGRLQGTRDIPILEPLSEETLLQIQKTKSLLDSVSFDAVYCSEKQRTRQTASAYGYVDAQAISLINEMDFGPFEGKLKSEAIETMGRDFFDSPLKTVLGPHYMNLERNIRSFLELTQTQSNILVFGHGSFIRGTKCIVDHGSIQLINSFPLSNNEIVVLELP